MQYSNNLDILLDSRHNSYTVEIPNAKDLVKRSSFSLDTDIFLGVQFYLGYPVVPFFHKCHTCNMAFPAVDRDRPNKGPPSPAKLEKFEKSQFDLSRFSLLVNHGQFRFDSVYKAFIFFMITIQN